MSHRPSPRAVAEAFSRALDRSDYAAVRALLAPDCAHDSEGVIRSGPDAVLESYAARSRWAERQFDEVRYESEVVGESGRRVTVRSTNYLLKVPGRWHRHRSEQDIDVDDDGRVARIVHRVIDQEEQRLAEFLRTAGIQT